MAVAQAAPATPKPSVKIKIGSRIIFNTVPRAATVMGNLVSPSPASIDRKNVDSTIKGNPTQITLRYDQPKSATSAAAPILNKICLP